MSDTKAGHSRAPELELEVKSSHQLSPAHLSAAMPRVSVIMHRLRICAAVLALSCVVMTCHAASNPITVAQGVIGRVLGADMVSSFSLETIPAATNGNDVFELEGGGGGKPLTVRGNKALSIVSGVYWYLKYTCNAELSWGVDGSGDQLDLPSPLPAVNNNGLLLRIVSPNKYRYSWNVCTFSYSMSWWDWSRWERELDFIAMQGVNMPLAFTGQEYIWAQVYKQLGLTEADLEAHFAGPAFLAWGRMGNIRGWGGPLAPWFRNASAALQKQILQRQTELGMSSSLPCFAGHVPEAITRLFPSANVTRSPDWARFPSPYGRDYLLSPTDPLFQRIGSLLMTTLNKEFGEVEWYQCDMYNEMEPAKSDPDYLGAASAAVVGGIQKVNPDGKWLMQGWLFHEGFWSNTNIKNYLGGVSNDAMMILDLNSAASPVFSHTDSYFGKPFIWCMLQDYGGNRGIYGQLPIIASGPITTRTSGQYSMVGTGITPEAIENAPVTFNLMFEHAWRNDLFSLDQWVANYTTRRYNCGAKPCPISQAAWHLLQTTVYTSGGISKSLMHLAPALTMAANTAPNATAVAEVFIMFKESATNELKMPLAGPFLYDMVDVGRQMMSNLFVDVHHMFRQAYQKYQLEGVNSTVEVNALAPVLLQMIKDTDTLLSSNVNYLLGRWLESAKAMGSTDDEKEWLEFNARNQVTLWGPSGQINDYAAKAWAGLLSDYYYNRWDLFVTSLTTCMKEGPACSGRFPADYEAKLLAQEQAWGHAQGTYPTEPTGDTMVIVADLASTYYATLDDYVAHPGMDVSGNDLLDGATWTKNPEQIAFLCNADPLCVGFNSNGWLKTSSTPTVPAAGATLYLKKTAAMAA